MSMNKKAIEGLFENRRGLRQVFTQSIDLVQEELDDDATFEDAIEIFTTRFNIIASEYVAENIFGYDMEEYCECHNDELTAQTLQYDINEMEC